MVKNSEIIKKHYLTEKHWEQKILQAKKNSPEREEYLAVGYKEVLRIMNQYHNASGDESSNELLSRMIMKFSNNHDKILDLGCGSGSLVYNLLTHGYLAEGADISAEEIAKAKARLKRMNKEDSVFVGSINTIKNKYDGIVLNNVLEHFVPDEINDILWKIQQLLNKNGWLFIVTPHAWAGPHDVSRYFLKIGQKAEGFHFKEYCFTELIDILKKNNFHSFYTCLVHPKFINFLKIGCRFSEKNIKKSLWLEKKFSQPILKKLFFINRSLSRFLVALFFPTIIIAKK